MFSSSKTHARRERSEASTYHPIERVGARADDRTRDRGDAYHRGRGTNRQRHRFVDVVGAHAGERVVHLPNRSAGACAREHAEMGFPRSA
jgi:hypothetical protein